MSLKSDLLWHRVLLLSCLLLPVLVLSESVGRDKRQLFREDIPHNRPLDGSYNQRPQGEGSRQGNGGVLPGDMDYPVRFEAHDAIIGVSHPQQEPPPALHYQQQPQLLIPTVSPQHVVYPQFQTYHPFQQQHNFANMYPAGPYPMQNLHPVSPASYETKLKALWRLNYDDGNLTTGGEIQMVPNKVKNNNELANGIEKGVMKRHQQRKRRNRTRKAQRNSYSSSSGGIKIMPSPGGAQAVKPAKDVQFS